MDFQAQIRICVHCVCGDNCFPRREQSDEAHTEQTRDCKPRVAEGRAIFHYRKVESAQFTHGK